MPIAVSNLVAAERLMACGYEAAEVYPGGVTKAWRAVHLACGTEVVLRLDPVERGHMPRNSCSCYAVKRADAERRAQATRSAANSRLALIGMREAGWEPLEPYPGSHNPWRCRCVDCGSESSPRFHSVSQRAGQSKLCQTCSGRLPVTADRAEAVMLAAGWQPLAPYSGLLEPWPCACTTCGHRGTPNYTTTKQGKSRCTRCATRERGDRARAQFEPTALQTMQDVDLEPLEPYPGANNPWRSKCLLCGDLVSPSCSNVAVGIRGCWTCSQPKRIAAMLAAKAPAAEARLRAAGYIPLEPYPGMAGPWLCQCRCGRETAVWTSVIGTGSRGCRACSEGGFKPLSPGATYLLIHEELGAVKVGITGEGTDRLRSFQRQGWQVVHSERFEVGYDAMSVERAILDWWRNELGLPPYLLAEDMPLLGGATETAELEMMPALTAVERMTQEATLLRESDRSGTAA